MLAEQNSVAKKSDTKSNNGLSVWAAFAVFNSKSLCLTKTLFSNNADMSVVKHLEAKIDPTAVGA